MECTDSNVSVDKTSKNKVSAVGANSLYIRKPCTIFFYEKVVKWCRPYTKTEYLKSLDEADKYHKEHDISQHSHLSKKGDPCFQHESPF